MRPGVCLGPLNSFVFVPPNLTFFVRDAAYSASWDGWTPLGNLCRSPEVGARLFQAGLGPTDFQSGLGPPGPPGATSAAAAGTACATAAAAATASPGTAAPVAKATVSAGAMGQ